MSRRARTRPTLILPVAAGDAVRIEPPVTGVPNPNDAGSVPDGGGVRQPTRELANQVWAACAHGNGTLESPEEQP